MEKSKENIRKKDKVKKAYNKSLTKMKYVGQGGYMDYPCYEDEEGKLYFDINFGRGEVNLYTGAYRHPEDGDICGEPEERVTKGYICI